VILYIRYRRLLAWWGTDPPPLNTLTRWGSDPEIPEELPFTAEEKEKIKVLLDKMNDIKNEPTKIKKILKEIYGVGKSTSGGLLLAYLKKQFGL